MNIHEEQKQIICYRFDAFCKKAMRYAARNGYRDMKRRQQHEISLDYLMEEYSQEPPSLNDDFTMLPIHRFYIGKIVISIENERLETALLQLSERKRELILLFYFAGIKEKELAKMYDCSRSKFTGGLSAPCLNYNNLFVIVVTISADAFSFRPPFISNASAAIISSITALTCTAVKSSNGSSRLQEKIPPCAHLNDIVSFVDIASPPCFQIHIDIHIILLRAHILRA